MDNEFYRRYQPSTFGFDKNSRFDDVFMYGRNTHSVSAASMLSNVPSLMQNTEKYMFVPMSFIEQKRIHMSYVSFRIEAQLLSILFHYHRLLNKHDA